MDDSTSLYMCSSCQQLFPSLKNVLDHHLTCHLIAHNNTTAPAQTLLELNPSQSKPDQISSPAKSSLNSRKLSNQGMESTTLTRPSLNLFLKNQTQRANPVPLIHYQCGECGTLFACLGQWQQHSRLRSCCIPESEEKGRSEDNVKPEASERQTKEGLEKEGKGTKTEKEEGLTVESDLQESAQAGLHNEAKTKNGASDQQSSNDLKIAGHVVTPDSGFVSVTLGSVPVETFLCKQCGSVFNSEQALAAHRSSHHGLEHVLHRCVVCSQEFMSTTQYLYHRRQHRSKGVGLPSTVAQSANHVLEFLSKIKGDSSLSPTVVSKEHVVSILETTQPSSPLPPSTPASFATSPVIENSSKASCPTCGQAFKRRCHMRVHMLRHSGQKPYRCEVCHKTFVYKSNLGCHRQTHMSRRAHICQHCGQSFRQLGALKKHLLLHACRESAPEKGLDGELEGTKEKDDEGEGQEGTRGMLFVCSDCPNKYRTRTPLLVHRFVHTEQYPFSCSTCGGSFPHKKSLQLHALFHQGVLKREVKLHYQSLECAGNNCLCAERIKAATADHRRKPVCLLCNGEGKQPLSCPSCSDQFPDQTSLDVHLPLCKQRDSSGQETDCSFLRVATKRNCGGDRGTGKLFCELCGHRCVTQEGLNLHRLSHSGQTPLRCPLLPCKRRFTSSSALQDHMLSHGPLNPETDTIGTDTKPRPHHCQQCGKSFTTASSLNVHLRIHTGERPFQCGQCGKRFRQIPHLRDHERLHTGTRPFVCSVCNRAFLLAARLAEHARTHSGEKPFQCTMCHRAFRSLSNLGKHRKTHCLALGNEPSPATLDLPSAEQLAGMGTVSKPLAGVNTVLLVQAPETMSQADTGCNPAQNVSSPAPLVFLQPLVSEEQEGVLTPVLHQSKEVVVAENNE